MGTQQIIYLKLLKKKNRLKDIINIEILQSYINNVIKKSLYST